MTTVPEFEHPIISVTVQVYVPAGNAVAVAEVCPPGIHKYVNPPLPPDGVAVAVPSLLSQDALVPDVTTLITGLIVTAVVLEEEPHTFVADIV